MARPVSAIVRDAAAATGCTGPAQHLLLLLASYSDRTGLVQGVSVPTMAAAMGRDERTVRRLMRDLEGGEVPQITVVQVSGRASAYLLTAVPADRYAEATPDTDDRGTPDMSVTPTPDTADRGTPDTSDRGGTGVRGTPDTSAPPTPMSPGRGCPGTPDGGVRFSPQTPLSVADREKRSSNTRAREADPAATTPTEAPAAIPFDPLVPIGLLDELIAEWQDLPGLYAEPRLGTDLGRLRVSTGRLAHERAAGLAVLGRARDRLREAVAEEVLT